MDKCKSLDIGRCGSFCILPDSGIVKGADYVLTITDSAEKKYWYPVTSDGYGALCVDMADFPAGFWNGILTLTIALASRPDVTVKVVYDFVGYTCIALIVKDIINSSPIVILPKVCLCIRAVDKPDWGELNTAMFSFVRRKSITLNHLAAQALAASNTFNSDMWYIITDAVNSFGVLRIRARNTSTLEKQGTLTRNGKSYTVEYSLDDGLGNDAITYLRDDFYNNTFFNYFDNISFIPNAPSNGTWRSNVFYLSTNPAISNASKVAISDSVFETNSDFNLSHNGSPDPQPIQINNTHLGQSCNLVVTADSSGGTSAIGTVTLETGSSLTIGESAACQNCLISNNSNVTVNDNGANNTTWLSGSVENFTNLVVQGISGASGTIVNNCNISNIGNVVVIKGGENYLYKTLNKNLSTFNGTRSIDITGAFSFIDSNLVANYDRSFIGIWTITAPVVHSVTSFTNRTTYYEHTVTYVLGAGSSPVTFVNNGVDIFMKGGANAVLANAKDSITFHFIGQVACESDRSIY